MMTAPSTQLAPQHGIPDVATFGALLTPAHPKTRCAKQLHAMLCACSPDMGRLERETNLLKLTTWLSKGPTPPPLTDPKLALPASTPEPPQVTRLRLLVAALEAVPSFLATFEAMVRAALIDHPSESLFARMGIPGDRGLLAETADRLSRRLMPQPVDEDDLTTLIARMFPRAQDILWIRSLPPELMQRLIEMLRHADDAADNMRPTLPGDAPVGTSGSDRPPANTEEALATSAWAPLRTALLDAIMLLASRTSSAGLSDDLRDRSPPGRLRDSPFFRLPRLIDGLLATPRQDVTQIDEWAAECRSVLAECGGVCDVVLAALERFGVSVDVVYRLDLIERSIARIDLLLDLLVQRVPLERARRATSLLALLLEERLRDRSLVDIVRTNTHMLARKVIERAGVTGEHYITVSRGEYFKMIASAAGGGVLTAFTGLFKVILGKLHRPLLQDGLLASLNYAVSFTLMQFLGFTLATKQPSMTAAAIAGAVKKGGADNEAMVTMTARVVRSQLAAAFGNVTFVIPAAFAVDWWWRARYGEHLLTLEYSEKVIASLHPTSSGTIPYAMLTGVILWASSLCAGWLENWSTYRRLPEAIAEHRIGRYVSMRLMGWISRVYARNIAGIGGNISIGLMLGLTYSFGQFIGIPADVRHVTLSTGSLTYAAVAQDANVLAIPGFFAAVGGIAIILFLNLSVSFTLALVVALRAREVGIREGLRMMAALLLGFVKSPLRFFFPTEKADAAAPHGPSHGAPHAS